MTKSKNKHEKYPKASDFIAGWIVAQKLMQALDNEKLKNESLHLKDLALSYIIK
jgi:hypothetical protein